MMSIFKKETEPNSNQQFISHLGHELRTPLTVMLGNIELLQARVAEDGLGQRYHSELEVIKSRCLHLNELVDSILISSENNKIERSEASEMSASLVTQRIYDRFKKIAAEKDLDFQIETSSDFPKHLLLDDRVERMVSILVDNAIKFTDRGSVRIVLTCAAQVRISVSDTGRGIRPEDLTRVFEPFFQAENSMSRRFSGLGLGLTVCQKLAKAEGGSIDVKSELGRGSHFQINLPKKVRFFSTASSAEMIAIEPMTSQPPRILVVDDAEEIRVIVKSVVTQIGASVDEAVDGAQALKKILEAEKTGRPYSLILMDMYMPQMNGYQATKMIRRRGLRNKILAVTAHATEFDRQKCLEIGCDDFLAKPFTTEGLMLAVNRFLERPQRTDTQTRSAPFNHSHD